MILHCPQCGEEPRKRLLAFSIYLCFLSIAIFTIVSLTTCSTVGFLASGVVALWAILFALWSKPNA